MKLSKEAKGIEVAARLVIGALGIAWCGSKGYLREPGSTQFLAAFVVLGLSMASASAFAHIYDRNSRR